MEEHSYSVCAGNMILEQLTLLYAGALKKHLFEVARKMCYGCQEEHLSQTRHSCITLTVEQKLRQYFLQTLIELDEREIIRRWKATIGDTDCPACLSQIRSVDDFVWRETRLKTNRWMKKMFQMVYKMIYLERRFYIS